MRATSKRFYVFPADDRTNHVIGWDVIDREQNAVITTFYIVRRTANPDSGTASSSAERMARAEARRLNAGGTRKQ